RPYYNHPSYDETSCQVTFSFQNDYRCCKYDTCQCVYFCFASLTCDTLGTQSLNQTSCCQSSSCCENWVWNTCYRSKCSSKNGVETCKQETYLCNYHCTRGNSVKQCMGRCGTCMDAKKTFFSQEWNRSNTISTHCDLDDFA